MSIILKGIDMPEKENRMYMMELYADGHYSVAKIEDGKCYELTIPSETEALQIPKGHGNIIDDQSIEEAEIFDGSRIMKWSRDDRDNHNVLFIRSTTLLEAEE